MYVNSNYLWVVGGQEAEIKKVGRKSHIMWTDYALS